MKLIMGQEAETKPVLTGAQKVSLAINLGVIGLLVAAHGHKVLSAHAHAVVLSVIAFTVIALLLKAIPARAEKPIQAMPEQTKVRTYRVVEQSSLQEDMLEIACPGNYPNSLFYQMNAN